jgi:sugar phosphate permease
MVFYGARKFAFALLAGCPFVLLKAGLDGVIAFMIVVMLVFGILRTIGETALYPWSYEFIPPRLRGQFSAISNIVATLVGLGALWVAGAYLAAHGGLAAYQLLIVVGAVFGLAAVLVKMPIQGGAPDPRPCRSASTFATCAAPCATPASDVPSGDWA